MFNFLTFFHNRNRVNILCTNNFVTKMSTKSGIPNIRFMKKNIFFYNKYDLRDQYRKPYFI